MQDRVSNHPDRWVLTPVTGQTNTYDFTRADDPTVTGTPLNKATFLPDAVASAVESATGVSDIDLPSEAIDALATAVSTIGISDNAKIGVTSYVGAGSTSTSAYKTLTFSFKPRIVIWVLNTWLPVSNTSSTTLGRQMMWIYNTPGGGTGSLTQYPCQVVVDNNTIKWRYTHSSDDIAALKMDTSGSTYYVVAVGVK